jgi:hypothetical protein
METAVEGPGNLKRRFANLEERRFAKWVVL